MAEPQAPPAVAGLLEREEGMSTLNDLLGSVRSDSAGRLLWLCGEAGIGKTALLQGFCTAQDRKVRILRGACEPLRTPRPLGPLMDVAETTGGDLAELAASDAKPHKVAAALLEELRGRRASVLVLEDLHWADEATLDVLTLVAAKISSAPTLVLASYRDDELDRAPALRFVLGEVARKAERLKLKPLSPAAVATLAEPHGLSGPELYDRTAGNPFYVTEVLAAGGEQLPDTVRDAVLARAARLPTPARKLLDAVAIVPGRAELWLLRALADPFVEHLDECLASGMLDTDGADVAFRHDLARCTIEESIGPGRRVALHEIALTALRDSGADPARLAHHADAAGDRDAVLEFAPVAAAHAALLGAHREAADQYARALRFADRLELRERAELLERLSDERFVLAQHDESIAAINEALDCYRELGDRRKQADALCTLHRRLYCPGYHTDSDDPAREALEVLADEPPCRELARTYALLAAEAMNSENGPETFEWGPRAIELAEQLGEHDLVAYALNDLGTMEYLSGVEGGRERLERSLELALAAGWDEHAARAFIHLAWVSSRLRDYGRATAYIERGMEYCTERDIELHALYLVTRRAQMELGQGRWDDAAESAAIVIDDRRSSPDALAPALAVRALVRARRGDPDYAAPLEQALALLEGRADLQRIGPVAAAQAEILWLERRSGDQAEATQDALALAVKCRAPWVVGELAYWRRQAGVSDELADELVAEPYRLSLAGDWVAAATRWRELGCPYEAALALADSDDEAALRQALNELQTLGARPAAAIVARRLRERGVRGVPRGPRTRTRENAAGLTARELDVVGLIAEGLRNADIAQRLVVSEKTVDHHVSAILRKLDAKTRGEAAVAAARLGLTGDGEAVRG